MSYLKYKRNTKWYKICLCRSLQLLLYRVFLEPNSGFLFYQILPGHHYYIQYIIDLSLSNKTEYSHLVHPVTIAPAPALWLFQSSHFMTYKNFIISSSLPDAAVVGKCFCQNMQVKSSTSVSQKWSLNCFCDVDDEKSFAAAAAIHIARNLEIFGKSSFALPIFVTQLLWLCWW